MLVLGAIAVLYLAGLGWAVTARREKFREALNEERTLPGSCLEGLFIIANLVIFWPVVVWRPPKSR